MIYKVAKRINYRYIDYADKENTRELRPGEFVNVVMYKQRVKIYQNKYLGDIDQNDLDSLVKVHDKIEIEEYKGDVKRCPECGFKVPVSDFYRLTGDRTATHCRDCFNSNGNANVKRTWRLT